MPKGAKKHGSTLIFHSAPGVAGMRHAYAPGFLACSSGAVSSADVRRDLSSTRLSVAASDAESISFNASRKL